MTKRDKAAMESLMAFLGWPSASVVEVNKKTGKAKTHRIVAKKPRARKAVKP